VKADNVPLGPETRRFAAVNMDWDQIKVWGDDMSRDGVLANIFFRLTHSFVSISRRQRIFTRFLKVSNQKVETSSQSRSTYPSSVKSG
jgi:hypothetical protein